MDLRIAKNIDEYLIIINEIKVKQKETWFRGQSSAEYSLLPSLFREYRILGDENKNKDGLYHRKSDAVMKSDLQALDKFKAFYDKNENTEGFNLIDYLYIMQHYDIPTRLLDFSTDELIALYFSVSEVNKSTEKIEMEMHDFQKNDGYSKEGSAVFCIDPKWTNKHAYNKEKVINLEKSSMDILNGIDMPICINTKNKNKRIQAQKGVFIYFGIMYNPYEYYTVLDDKIIKIFIPNSCRRHILDELKLKFGVSHSTIYPDIKGISLEIIDEINIQYKIDCEKYFN